MTGGPVDLLHLVAEGPAQKIDAVNALIHKGSAILRPGTSPGCLIIVGLVPVPANVDGAVGQRPEPSCFQRAAHLLHCYIEAVLVAGRNLHALLLRTADDLLCICHGHSHGLLDNHRDPKVDGIQRDPCVGTAFCGDGYQFRLRLLQHFLIIRIPGYGSILLQTVLRQNFLHMRRFDIADCHDLQLVVQRCFDMIR